MNSYSPTSLESASASELNDYARTLDKQTDTTFLQIGLICVHVNESKKWHELGFRKFTGWLEDAFPRSRSTAYDAFDCLSVLMPVVPWAKLCEMRIVNLKIMAKQCSTAVQEDPQMWDAAAGSSSAFIDKANTEHNQLIEKPDFWNLAPRGWQKVTLADTVDLVRIVDDTPEASVTDCIVQACDFYITEMRERNAKQIAEKIASSTGQSVM